MRRPVDAAPPARHALLGLLLEGPRHGYDLIRAFAPGTPLGSTIHLGASHVYALLARLERDDLVAGEEQPRVTHPPRRVFQITEAGRTDVLRWLDEPVTRPREVLLDFPLKLYLAQRLDPARAGALVARQRALFARLLSDMEAEEPPTDAGLDSAFLRFLHDGRIIRTRATLEWLDRCAGRMDTPEPGN
ncbi:MAG TPA: PadR family transcriptional regulator [Chloroflexota bacterium]|nr:PadR family transcriptional regulator [Chloroflexota bacterium]